MNVEVVKEYYGKVLKGSKDLKTSACCDGGGVPGHLETLIANVHEEVRSKYYGCGIVIPAALQGCKMPCALKQSRFDKAILRADLAAKSSWSCCQKLTKKAPRSKQSVCAKPYRPPNYRGACRSP